jgi:hypothetical protein
MEDVGETGKAVEGAAALRAGKNRGTSLLRGPAEGIGQTDSVSKKGRASSKSLSGDDADTAAAALVRPVVPKADETSLDGGAVEGETLTAALEGLAPEDMAGGGEIPDAPVLPDEGAGTASRVLAETAGLPRYDAEDLEAETEQNAGSLVRGTGEKEGRGSRDVRVRDRRRERSNPEAGDVRAGLDKRDLAGSPRSPVEAGKGEEASRSGGRETESGSSEGSSTEGSSTELIVELRSLGKTQAEISAERENRPVQSFQNMLARELHENLNGDIVRHASVMLRDGGEGTIRLALRPETLGTVKIRLEITENKIAGHIIVESDEAFRAFEQELHSLEQSFRDSGFDGAQFDMAFASDGREGRRGQEEGADGLFSGRLAALCYDDAVTVVPENADGGQWTGMRPDGRGMPLVNMLV